MPTEGDLRRRSIATGAGLGLDLKPQISRSHSSTNNIARLRKPSIRRRPTESPVTEYAGEEAERRAKDAIRRKQIIRELVETERTYLRSLSEVDTHYLRPLLMAAGSSSPVLDRKTITEMFSNFADILKLAKELHRRLVFGSGSPPPSISVASALAAPDAAQSGAEAVAISSGTPGALLLPLCPFLKCYGPFVQNFSRALERMELERSSNSRWRKFCDERTKRGIGSGLGLSAMLLGVIQRIPRYLLLLSDLLKHTPENDPDRSDLVSAHRIVAQVADSLDRTIAAHKQTLETIDLQRAFLNLDIPLIAPGRTLLKQGRLMKVCRRGDQQERAFFLFSDMLLCAYVNDPNSLASGWSRLSSMTGLAALAASPSLSGGLSAAASTPQYTFSRRFDLEDLTVVGAEGLYFELRSSTKSFAVSGGVQADPYSLTSRRFEGDQVRVDRRHQIGQR